MLAVLHKRSNSIIVISAYQKEGNMRKICVVTGTRAEYGLLYWLMKEISDSVDLELQIIATGAHLSPEFGLTYREIDFEIDKKIEILLSSDTSVGITKSTGLAQISFAEAYDELSPDFVVLLGDRFEILSAAIAAMIANIPIVHLHGGETTEGAFDESIRHAITKMSHLHFTAAEAYKNRVIQLGEQPQTVFNVGGMGIENIKRMSLLDQDQLEEQLGFKFEEKNLLVTFHPVTLEQNSAASQFLELLNALDKLENTKIIFTKANSDTDGRVINSMIDEYVLDNSHKSVAFTSLGQLRFLSCLQYVDAVVGNSSSGISEAPSFKIGTINIGDRQKGRLKSLSIIDCNPIASDITRSLDLLYSNNFKKIIENSQNPYESDGFASRKIIEILKEPNLDRNLLKKSFYNLESSTYE